MKRRDAASPGQQRLGTPPKMWALTPPRSMSPRRPAEEADKPSQPAVGKLDIKPKPMSIRQPATDAPISSTSAPVAASGGLGDFPFKKDSPIAPAQKPAPRPKPVLDDALQRQPDPFPLPATRRPVSVPASSQTKGPPVAPRGSGKQQVSASPSQRESRPTVPPAKPKLQSQTEAHAAERSITPPPPHVIRGATAEVRSPQPKRVIPNPMLEAPTLPFRTPSSRASVTEERRTDLAGDRQDRDAIRPVSQDSASSDDTFVSASSTQSPRASSPVRGEELSISDHHLQHVARNQQTAQLSIPSHARSSAPYLSSLNPPKHIRSNSTSAVSASASTLSLPLDSLTSAMMASNLAASRSASSATSPAGNSPVPPPPRRSTHQAHHSPLNSANTGGSPSRKRGNSTKSSGRLLQTLRAPTSLSDDEDARRRLERYRKKHLGGKKHAHHEGSRHRWRDEITLRERRRYEALWASNRGLFLDPTQLRQYQITQGVPSLADQVLDPDELVVNVVVRDIWSRSRLPLDELTEVWDLVDRSRLGALRKHEFVVGMWLIDQRLRGRKLPARVGDSVWDSARDLRIARPEKVGKRK